MALEVHAEEVLLHAIVRSKPRDRLLAYVAAFFETHLQARQSIDYTSVKSFMKQFAATMKLISSTQAYGLPQSSLERIEVFSKLSTCDWSTILHPNQVVEKDALYGLTGLDEKNSGWHLGLRSFTGRAPSRPCRSFADSRLH